MAASLPAEGSRTVAATRLAGSDACTWHAAASELSWGALESFAREKLLSQGVS